MSHLEMKQQGLKNIHYQTGVMLARLTFEFPGEVMSPSN
jgi:hypothetical protein